VDKFQLNVFVEACTLICSVNFTLISGWRRQRICGIYDYIPETNFFFGCIVLQLFCIYNLYCITCFFSCEICFVRLYQIINDDDYDDDNNNNNNNNGCYGA
jgi:hypothetical protein